ncbi:MAG: ABC transporter substrate-binding protein [Candidatus Coatesbacteria bacterium]|nr:MAG: ABC transporter substrate-binding protein [Candidatus Coatesbacteria bacterium]
MKSYFRKSAIASVLLILPLLCNTCFPRKEYIVGIVGTETGPNAEIGISVVRGAGLRCTEINISKKKLNKRFLTCVHYDDAGDPELTETHTRRLVEVDEAAAVILATASKDGAERALKVCTNARVPMISVSGFLAEDNTTGKGCYEIGLDGPAMSSALVGYLQETYGYNRVGFLVIGDYEVPPGVKDAVGIDVNPNRTIELNTSIGTDDIDIIAVTPDVRFADLEVLYVYGTVRDTFRLARELEVDGVYLPIVNIKPFGDPEILDEEITTSESLVLISPVPLEYGEARAIKFERYFEDIKGYRPNFYSALGYDAMDLVARAIKETKGTEPDEIKAEWEKLGTWEGIVGRTDFKTGKTDFDYYVIEVTIISNRPKVETLTII